MGKEQIVVKINPDSMPSGSDLAVVNAARRSFGKRSNWETISVSYQELEESGDTYNDWEIVEEFWEPYSGYDLRKLKDQDKRLIEFLARGMTAGDFEGFLYTISSKGETYLDWGFDSSDAGELSKLLWNWRNTPTHDTPFNHCFVSFEIKAAIFVARQLVKTEYAPFSEFSRRYITDDVEFYQHDYREASKDKKQGSGGIHEGNEHWQKIARMKNQESLDQYNRMIDDGVAPEQARGCLPADLMTAWTWSMTLGAAAKMCRERLGSDAQAETRYVAEQVYEYLKGYYPVSAKALVEGPDT